MTASLLLCPPLTQRANGVPTKTSPPSPPPCAKSKRSTTSPLCRLADMRQFSHEQSTHTKPNRSNHPRTLQSAPRRSARSIHLLTRPVQSPQSHPPRAGNDPRIRVLRDRAFVHRAHQRRACIDPAPRIPNPRNRAPHRSTQRPPPVPVPRRIPAQVRIQTLVPPPVPPPS